MPIVSDRRPILLANDRIVDPSRDLDFPGDLLIAEGMIREAKRGIGAAGVPEGTDVVDCKGRIVAPGLIDIRAFVGEPGAEYRETFATASQAAAAGGVTTIICQPDTTPAIDDPAIVDFILRRARDTAIVHVQPMAALTKGLEGKEMTEIGLLKAAGAVAFTDGARSVTNAQVMRRAKDAGLPVTASASINHLTLNEIDIGPYRTFFKVSPPLRAEDDRAALVEAVASGLIDIVMSDHNPQDVETKRLPFAEAAPGAIGLETMLTAGLRLVNAERLSLLTLLGAMSTRPARLLGLPGGSLRGGAPADVIVIDPDAAWLLDPDDLKSKCKNTPFDEARLEGRVVRTIVAGRTAYEYASA